MERSRSEVRSGGAGRRWNGGRGGRMEDTAQRSDGVIMADLPLVDSSLTFT
jgi:hypothetical protein